MREILFKAKEKDVGDWVQGYIIKISEDDYRIATKDNIDYSYTSNYDYDGVMTCIDENTICQYTGLIDKNGNKIWENDILLSEPPLIPTPQFVVKYNQCTASFVGTYLDYEKAFTINDEITKYCKVVGSLFDNDVVLK